MARWVALLVVLIGSALFSVQGAVAAGANPAAPSHSATSAEAVMQQFGDGDEVSPQRKITTERKHQILFLMGVALLLLLLLTGGFGVAMIAFNKNVFVPHMIFAGLSITLAIVHSATAIAWFWPW